MRAFCILLILFSIPVYAQEEMRSTEIHLGFGMQNVAHGGIRQRIGDFLLAEANLGVVVYGSGNIIHSLGLSYLPVRTRSEKGFFYTLLYSLHAASFFSTEVDNYAHIVTANLGWISQHTEGFSFLARAGLGFVDIYNSRYDWNTGIATYTKEERRFWGNLEFGFGYAF